MSELQYFKFRSQNGMLLLVPDALRNIKNNREFKKVLASPYTTFTAHIYLLHKMRAFTVIAIIAAFALSFTACKKKDFLYDYNTSELFATPTDTEKAAVMHDWQQRDLSITQYAVLNQLLVAGGRYILKLVSYRFQNMNEYGALLIPAQAGTFPVRMMVGGFGHEITTNTLNVGIDSTTDGTFILAVPALRGQSLSLTVNGVAYTTPVSEGRHCDAFDGGTDDVLAMLNLIDTLEEKADVTRTAVRGGSRGGTVALLAGIRDARVKRVVNVVGPTDMLILTKATVNDPTYQCQFLDDLVNKQASVAATRHKMIASSPIYFTEHLPLVQVHMGSKDNMVPVEQGNLLLQRMTEQGLADRLEFYVYYKTHEDIATDNPDLNTRIQQFLAPL